MAEQNAICMLIGADGPKGIIHFTPTDNGTKITGSVSGLTPGKHGFHVHQFGDTSNGCTSTGGHYNPFGKQHGAPTDSNRHVGDLGNIVADADGNAEVNITDELVEIPKIIGRAIVVHDGVDDLGKGGHEQSLTTGNAGGRFCCGIIGFGSK